jgi:hypothetical protein
MVLRNHGTNDCARITAADESTWSQTHMLTGWMGIF